MDHSHPERCQQVWAKMGDLRIKHGVCLEHVYTARGISHKINTHTVVIGPRGSEATTRS